MIKERRIRALVMINPISFFYSRGKPKGLKYEMLEQFQSVVNRQFRTKTLKVRVTFIPMRPDELGLALTQGVGDVIAEGVWITPGRQEHYAFTTPTKNKVSEIIVTGKELANTKSFDDLVGKDIYVNPLTTAYTNLNRINDQRSKVGKTPLQVKAVDKNLLEDDLIEMVNAGLLPATVAMQHRAGLWEQVLPNIKLHEDMVVGSGGQLGWVVRKDNPKLKQLLDKFIAEYGEGTSFGNTLLRRYLQNQKWIKNSTAEEEMRKFGVYVELFKKYATQYNFDYLMITAQAYQESTLDQSKRSHAGAVGIMQVIPKYAAAHPIRIPDVSKPDKNILAGVRIMNYILTNFVNDPAIDPVNKTLLTFASYNAGPTRIARLRRQAQQHGMDPNKWFGNVELEVAKDIGEETVTYVDNIYKYYVAYKLAADRIEDLQKAKLAAK
jgi:membrane-bound lytic murein transglycosylase MltF